MTSAVAKFQTSENWSELIRMRPPESIDRIDLVEATRERAGETPGFPAEPGGSHELHAAFLNESRTRGHC